MSWMRKTKSERAQCSQKHTGSRKAGVWILNITVPTWLVLILVAHYGKEEILRLSKPLGDSFILCTLVTEKSVPQFLKYYPISCSKLESSIKPWISSSVHTFMKPNWDVQLSWFLASPVLSSWLPLSAPCFVNLPASGSCSICLSVTIYFT